MRERFDARDYRFIAVCLAVALLCGTLAWRWFERAFPEASIEFEVNRAGSADVARDFLGALKFDPSGYKHVAIFDYDDDSKLFLERELGLERAQEVYGQQVRLWRWSHRWFKPRQKEELRVDVTTKGEIAHFEHLIPEDAQGARLEPEAARRIAESFLARRMHVRLADYEFVEGASTQQPHRVDHTFTWKRRGFDVHDATYRMTVQVSGDRVTVYDEFLDIPQVWRDAYARLRSHNETAALVASVLLLLTVLAMIVVLVLRIRDADVRWRTAVAFGSVAFVLQLLAALNQFDIQQFAYETQDSYASFVTEFLLLSVLGALAYGSIILLLTAAAEPVYRERFPGRMSLPGFFTRQGLRTKTFFKQVLLGLTLTLFFAAYQTVFYLVAGHFGAWAPLEVPYSNMLNTAIPWAVVLFIGFFPAVSEEFISRLFSVPFLDKHLGRALGPRAGLVLAVVLSSFIWGFAHSNYPNQPYFIRGIEVGLAGLVVSFVMLRWGILAALVWHYTVDAFYTAFLLLRSGNPYFVISGSITAGLMLVPLAAALVLYRLRGGFEPEAGLQNPERPSALPGAAPAMAAIPEVAAVAAVEPQPASGPAYRPVPRQRWWVGGGVAAALLFLFAIPADEAGDGIQVRSQRAQALQAGRIHLRDFGADPDSYRVLVQMASRYQREVGGYVLERKSLDELNGLYTDRLRTPVWRVRFFQPDQKEEWIFNLPVDVVRRPAPALQSAERPDSSAHRPHRAGPEPAIPLWAFEHVLPDSARGDTLTAETAQLLAEDFLRSQGIDPDAMQIKERRSEKQRARLDHTFEWQVPDSTLGEAGIRYLVVVRGGEVAALRPYMHLPESWLRAYQEQSVLQRILWVLSRGILGMLLLGLVGLFIVQVRARRFPWLDSLRWGTVSGVLSLGIVALRWRTDFLVRFETTTPYQLFLIGAAIGVFLQVLFMFLTVALVVGTMLSLRPQTRGLLAGGRSRAYLRDALLLALLGFALQIGLHRFTVVLADYGSRWLPVNELLLAETAARPLPWLDLLLGQLRSALRLLPCIAIAAVMAQRGLGRRRSAIFVLLAVLLFAADGARSWPEFALQGLVNLATLGLALFVIAYLYRGNELAYVVMFLAGRALATGYEWMSQPALRAAGVLFTLLMLALTAFVTWAAARRPRRALASSTSQAPIPPPS